MPAPQYPEVLFKHDVREAREQVSESHTWTATIAGYDVIACRNGDGRFSLHIAPEHFEGARLGIVQMHPRRLAELEAFAEVAAQVLPAVAAALRQALGTDDVRSQWDKMHDDMKASVARDTAKLLRRIHRTPAAEKKRCHEK